ncbi:transcriptional regulator [Bifidobacterium primatium]|uniref:Transcriptional regulator n=2 Tax=Bifidobacterium TaxID=1678 RepID=A0A2M9HAF1_9BIFI|nr:MULTISPECIES: LacI family DNA-binding transcriptional regulator [Bifidobacterium]NEG96558.1 LacI family DNA-binding transcriptional regulator [Bifidobacterium sp. SMB2]NEH10525.1 LacI family DNA-binding transcriptional regulator [Bifidobacterium saimiriisciurei]NEH10692.1 LacI family DNA-binding transcriptional regulator [Bifidobacterium saimiriisciurei]PJM73790.1 transcriptional regulator [Bifidobacterium primatium]
MNSRKTITIKEVAKVAGVSVTTVSRYLNGNLGKMSVATQQKIQQVIQDLNYRPSAAAKNMRSDSTHIIGVIVGDISNVFASMLFTGMYKALQPQNYSVMLLNANDGADEERECVEKLLQQNVDGLIIQPSRSNFEDYYPIVNARTPLAFVDRYVDATPPSVIHVTSDNYEASQRMCEELAGKGYRHIVVVNITTVGTSAQIPRLHAITEAARRLGLRLSVLDLAGGDNAWLTDTLRVISANSAQERTAVVSLMGPLLLRVLAAARELGMDFPRDMGLLSFDDWEWGEYVGHGIDLILQDPETIGRKAGEALLATIRKQPPVSNEIVVPTKRVLGHSL